MVNTSGLARCPFVLSILFRPVSLFPSSSSFSTRKSFTFFRENGLSSFHVFGTGVCLHNVCVHVRCPRQVNITVGTKQRRERSYVCKCKNGQLFSAVPPFNPIYSPFLSPSSLSQLSPTSSFSLFLLPFAEKSDEIYPGIRTKINRNKAKGKKGYISWKFVGRGKSKRL